MKIDSLFTKFLLGQDSPEQTTEVWNKKNKKNQNLN